MTNGFNSRKVFVNRYHYDVRNHEWEKENGVPKTNVEVTFQLHNKDEEANNTSVVAVLQFMIVRDEFVISGIVSQMDHIQNRIVNEPKTSHKKKQKPWLHRSWIRFNV